MGFSTFFFSLTRGTLGLQLIASGLLPPFSEELFSCRLEGLDRYYGEEHLAAFAIII
jgi:hypothetical protein